MRVILEGPDNAGKTTLANMIKNLCKDLPIVYFHPGGKPEDVEAEIRCMDEQFDLLRDPMILMDRVTSISQRVYNPDNSMYLRRHHAWRALEARKPIVIYCRPSTDRLLRVQDLTWREGETEEHKQKIIKNQHLFVERYDNIFHAIPCVTYDFEDKANADVIVTKLVQGFNGQADAVQWFYDLMYNYRSA